MAAMSTLIKYWVLALGLLLTGAAHGQVTIGGSTSIGGSTLVCTPGITPTCATPTASPAAGSYSSTQNVALATTTGGAAICYTTDGTTPTAATGSCTHGTTYSGAVSVSSSLTIKAIATLSGYTNSGALTAAYTISGGSGAAFSATPTSVSEGSIPTNTTAYFTPVTVTNTGTSNLTFSSIGFTGTNAADFAVTQGFLPAVNPVGGNTLPQCSTSTPVAPSASCIVPVEFAPGASSARSASLSFSDNASGSPHTVALTGTGVAPSGTVLTSANCGSLLAANTTYYFTGNVTCPNSAYGISGAGVVVNLNGYTLSFGNAPTYSGASQLGFYSAPSFDALFSGSTCGLSGAAYNCGNGITATGMGGAVTVENGTINVGSGATSAGTMQYGDIAFYTGANSGDNWILHDLTVNIPLNCTSCQMIGGFLGSVNTYNGNGYKLYKVSVNDSSGFVNSRCDFQGYPINLGGDTASLANPGPIVYENTITNSPQGGIVMATTYGYAFGNTIKIGNPTGSDAGTSSTCGALGTGSNGTNGANNFGVEASNSNMWIVNNTINNFQGRGIDMSAPVSALTGVVSAGNTITTTDLPNYVEYQGNSPNGCQIGGAYGERLNSFGTTSTMSSSGETIVVTNTHCNGTGYSISSSNNASNFTQNGNYTCKFGSGYTAGLNCPGITNGDQDYVSGTPAMIYSTGETITGDTTAVAVGYAPTGMAGPWTLTNDTFVKPSTATTGSCGDPGTPRIPNWTTFSGCTASLGSAVTMGPLYVRNPTWIGGASENSDDYSTATSLMTGGTTASRYIQYLYTLTVTNGGTPVSGATVKAVDKLGTTECNTTTNSSGKALCWLNENEYSFTAPNAPVTTNFSPINFAVASSGCSTNTFNVTVGTANVSVPVALAGCGSMVVANNTDDSLTGWSTCYIGSCAGGGTPGGSGTPTAVSQTISNATPSLDGASMLFSQTTATSHTNVLWTFKTTVCDNCTIFRSDYWVYLGSNTAKAEALEFDAFDFDVTHNVEDMFGTECDQTNGLWQIWNQQSGNWINTTLACTLTYSAWHHIQRSEHRVIGDTSCSGQQCMHYDSITIDGVTTNWNLTEPASVLPSGWTSATGYQFQTDIGTISSSQTVVENIDEANFWAN